MPLPSPFFYVLKGHNPFEHLAAEDFLLRHSSRPGMALWVSRPCVVMGRFQNPWQEIRWQSLGKRNVWMARRQSGGGTVYQDEGNLNFSFFGDIKYLSKNLHLSLVKKALRPFGITLTQNQKFDLILCKKGCHFKVSGNAFKQTKGRFLHHGTLLINTNLKNLEELLTPLPLSLESRAIRSNRAPVANLRGSGGTLSLELDKDILIRAFKDVFQAYWRSLGIRLFSFQEVPSKAILTSNALRKFQGPSWIWGETPPFSWKLKNRTFHFSKGALKKMTSHLAPGFSPLFFSQGLKDFFNSEFF